MQSALCGCDVHRKLQVVGDYFDLSLFWDGDIWYHLVLLFYCKRSTPNGSGCFVLLPLAARWYYTYYTWSSRRSRKPRETVQKNAALKRAVCNRKLHHNPVDLVQSFPSQLVLLSSNHLRLFVFCSWRRYETYSLLFLKEGIRWLIK